MPTCRTLLCMPCATMWPAILLLVVFVGRLLGSAVLAVELAQEIRVLKQSEHDGKHIETRLSEPAYRGIASCMRFRFALQLCMVWIAKVV